MHTSNSSDTQDVKAGICVARTYTCMLYPGLLFNLCHKTQSLYKENYFSNTAFPTAIFISHILCLGNNCGHSYHCQKKRKEGAGGRERHTQNSSRHTPKLSCSSYVLINTPRNAPWHYSVHKEQTAN